MWLLLLALFIYVAVTACKFFYRLAKSDYFGSAIGHILRTILYIAVGAVILWLCALVWMWAYSEYNAASEITQLKWMMVVCTGYIAYSIYQVGMVLERKMDRIEYMHG